MPEPKNKQDKEQMVSQVDPGVLAILDKLTEKMDAMSAKAYMEEQKKPTDAQLQKKAERRWQAAQDEKARKAHEQAKIASCGHIHPDNGKSRFFKFPVGEQISQIGRFPRGAGMMICSNCFYKLKNFEVTEKKVPIEGGFYRVESEAKLVHNPEFDYWFKMPTVSQGTLFGA